MKPHRIRALVGFVGVVIVVATPLRLSVMPPTRPEHSREPIRTATAPSSFV